MAQHTLKYIHKKEDIVKEYFKKKLKKKLKNKLNNKLKKRKMLEVLPAPQLKGAHGQKPLRPTWVNKAEAIKTNDKPHQRYCKPISSRIP